MLSSSVALTPAPSEATPEQRQLALDILRALWAKRQASDVLKDYKVDSAGLEDLFDAVPGFEDAYRRALWDKKWRGRKITFRLFDGIYPAWKEILLQNLEEQAQAGKRPKLSVAVKALNELGMPVKVGWVYHLSQPSSRYYNEEFALAVQTVVSETVQEIRELLEDDLADPSNDKVTATRLAYLKSIPQSGFGESSRVQVEQTTVREDRTTISVELVEKTHELGEQLKRRLIDVSPEPRGEAGVEGGGDSQGRSRSGSRGRAPKGKEAPQAKARRQARKARREKARKKG